MKSELKKRRRKVLTARRVRKRIRREEKLARKEKAAANWRSFFNYGNN
jgi:hypothetical protein